jgi:hypothetical protein
MRFGITENDWVTGVAADQVAFPDWEAVIEQLPAARIATALPETAHTDVVPELKVTGNPELAVAAIASGAVPAPCTDMAPKLISCEVPWITLNVWVTGIAAV